jgi:hypothetical protein
MDERPLLQQFDQVHITTTKRVSYLSDKQGNAPSPHGVWHVVGFVDGEALLSKNTALIRIPINDVKKVAEYNPEHVVNMLRSVSGYGQEQKENSRTKTQENVRRSARGGDS